VVDLVSQAIWVAFATDDSGGGTSDFPNAATTGVQDGVTLTPRGDWDINAPGTYQNMQVDGYVVINANNVTLRNCLVTAQPGQVGGVVYVASGKTGVVIEYCDLDGAQVQGLKGIWCDDSVGTMMRFNDIAHCEDGIYLTNNNHEIRDNYIHDLDATAPDPHHDNIQIGGSGTGIIIDHNTLIGAADANAILQFGNAFGNISVTLNHNLMRPGPVMLCLLNLGDSANGNTVVWDVTNNHMEPGHHGAGPQFGYATWNVNPPTTWTGNVDADTLVSIPPPT
jgi:hypothetical protein